MPLPAAQGPHLPPRLSRCSRAPPSGSPVFQWWLESSLCPATSDRSDRLRPQPPPAAPARPRSYGASSAFRGAVSGRRVRTRTLKKGPQSWGRGRGSQSGPRTLGPQGPSVEFVCVRARGKRFGISTVSVGGKHLHERHRWLLHPRRRLPPSAAIPEPLWSHLSPRAPQPPEILQDRRAGSPGSPEGIGLQPAGPRTLPSQSEHRRAPPPFAKPSPWGA